MQVKDSLNRRNFVKIAAIAVTGLALGGCDDPNAVQVSGGWIKSVNNPVLGGSLGICFDCTLLKENNLYRMWFSWRPRKSIAYVESQDGIHWNEPTIALAPDTATNWESEVNRPRVIKQGDSYHLWYTGQTADKSWIGYATSLDGHSWKRESDKPVLSPEQAWEKTTVMCPDVLWDENTKLFRMWYSAGEQYEPDAIGYATSPDGKNWTKLAANPIFRAEPNNSWEKAKVTACQVLPYQDGYVMFYIGFADQDHAQIGVAHSKDGITAWKRHAANPIMRPSGSDNGWDHDAVYKPAILMEDNRWLLWYNGRRKEVEQIGLAIHENLDLGFI